MSRGSSIIDVASDAAKVPTPGCARASPRGGFGGKLFEKASAAAHPGVATERDVAEVIWFLACDRSQRVTGQVIGVNGISTG